MRPDRSNLALRATESVAGDFQSLARRLGPGGEFIGLEAVAGAVRVKARSLAGLRTFLFKYRNEILLPLELNAICRAHGHATKNQADELLQLDRQLATEPRLAAFAPASREIGRAQLLRLQPLRDQRLVQRYVRAAFEGNAHGWHTLVYGVTLALYSLPLRQGLVNYAEKVLAGFITSAARKCRLAESDAQKLLAELFSGLPQLIEAALSDAISTAPVFAR